MVAAATAAEQVRILQANGIDEFHFYTLNRPDLVYAIARILGVKPATGRRGGVSPAQHHERLSRQPEPGAA